MGSKASLNQRSFEKKEEFCQEKEIFKILYWIFSKYATLVKILNSKAFIWPAIEKLYIINFNYKTLSVNSSHPFLNS